MATVVPSERFRRELDDTLEGVGGETDPIEAIGRPLVALIFRGS